MKKVKVKKVKVKKVKVKKVKVKKVKVFSQVWLWYNLESPFHASLDGKLDSQLEWTATYRRDSTIVAPYAKVSSCFSSIRQDRKLKSFLFSVERLDRKSKS